MRWGGAEYRLDSMFKFFGATHLGHQRKIAQQEPERPAPDESGRDAPAPVALALRNFTRVAPKNLNIEFKAACSPT